jgi:very-short-patch-repair endonuclease
VIEQRRLICGDAYAFQGDERHIIFLSMVAAPGETRIGVLSNDSARQRFNVAASRAQDQLWLFHSATLDVLSPACMRHRLLGYMLNPGRQMTDMGSHRFDSQFERDVFQLVCDRSFFVRTQVCVGDPTSHRYRIDLVVEGLQGRIAVECDGDEWHGPERYDQDMARQRDLERAGWQFVRIRGSDFYRDRSRAMEPVWGELDRLGIRPGGIDEAAAEPPPPASAQDAERREVDEIIPGVAVPIDSASDPDTIDADSEPVHEQCGLLDDNATRVASASSQSPANGILADYVPYSGAAFPDPRTVSAGFVADSLCLIIEAEGPMIAKRAYDIYLRGCGIKRLGGELKSTMNKALANAVRQGRVISENEPGTSGLLLSTVRLHESPPVKMRRRGPRSFEKIPPGELRVVGHHLSETRDIGFGSNEHLRAILECFDLKRLTTQVETTLLEILASVERTVVRVEGPGAGRVEVQTPEESAAPGKSGEIANVGGDAGQQRTFDPIALEANRHWCEEFVKRIRFDDPAQPVGRVGYGRIFLDLPVQWAWMTAYSSRRVNVCGNSLALKGDPGHNIFEALQLERPEIEAELTVASEGLNIVWQRDDAQCWLYANRKFPGKWTLEQEDFQLAWLLSATNRFVNAVRPRVLRLLPQARGS